MDSTILSRAEETNRFRQKWIDEIWYWVKRYQTRQKGGDTDYWEGYKAAREIVEANYYSPTLPRPGEEADYYFGGFTEQLAREVYVYKQFRDTVAPNNRCFRDAIQALSAARSRLTKVKLEESRVGKEVEDHLEHCSAVLKRSLDALEGRRNNYWKKEPLAVSSAPLPATPAETRVKDMLQELGASWLHKRASPLSRKQLIQLERRLKKAPYPADLLKRRELDTRFQERVALILREYYRYMTQSTISRLVVLTYKVGGLCREEEDQLMLKDANTPITVYNISRNLDPARLRRRIQTK